MKDLEIILENKPGKLGQMGQILGKNNISLEGGGVFGNGKKSTAHFLIKEAQKAKEILEFHKFEVKRINDVIILKLRQDVPGQLGEICRRLAFENINILTQYSDHHNQLILVVDDYEGAKKVSEKWMKEWW